MPSPAPEEPEAPAEESEAPKRKKRRRKDKAPTEDTVPGVTPKAAPLAPPSSPEAGRVAGKAHAEGHRTSPPAHGDTVREAGEMLAPHQAATKPKRRAKKPREATEEPEAPPQVAVPTEANGTGEKEKPKRRKRRQKPAEQEAEAPPNEKPAEASVHRAATADQEMLLATIEDLAAKAPASVEDVPAERAAQAPTRRRRRRKVQTAAPAAEEEVPPKEADEPDEADAKYGDLIRSVYQRHNPAKLGEVESLLEKYKGMEAALYQKVCEKYSERPQDIENGASPGADGGPPRGFAKKASAPPPPGPAPKAAPSRVATGEAWPFVEDEVSMNSESSDASSDSEKPQATEAVPAPAEASHGPSQPPALPPDSGVVHPPGFPAEEPNSPSSASSSSSASPPPPAHDELMQRFSSLGPRASPPGDAASWTHALRHSEAAPPPRTPEPQPELPAWARPPGGSSSHQRSPPRLAEPPREGREDAPLPSWAMVQDGPPGDWSSRPRRYSGPPPPPPSYGPPPRMGPGPHGPPGWGGKGWGYAPPGGYAALPAPHGAGAVPRAWGGESIGSAWAG